MSAQLAEQVNYDVICSSELPHYMTLDEMHARLTAKIHEFYSKFTIPRLTNNCLK